MYYAANLISCFLTIIAISIVYGKTAPPWIIMILLFSTGFFQLVASVWIVEKHDDLEDRIEELENRKVDK